MSRKKRRLRGSSDSGPRHSTTNPVRRSSPPTTSINHLTRTRRCEGYLYAWGPGSAATGTTDRCPCAYRLPLPDKSTIYPSFVAASSSDVRADHQCCPGDLFGLPDRNGG